MITHTQTRSCTLSYCNHGRKIVDAITWRIKHTRLQKWLWLVLSSLPWKSLQVTKQKAKQSTATNHYYMKEHSTININIINLDASSQLYRLCISILIGFLPLVSGNESVSGSGCVFGTGMESGNGNDIFESSYFYLDFYWICVFLAENDSCYGCDVYIDSIDLFLQVSLAYGAPALVSWPFR